MSSLKIALHSITRRFRSNIITPTLESYLEKLQERHKMLVERRADPNLDPQEMAQVAKEATEYEPLVEHFERWRKSGLNLDGLRKMVCFEKDAAMAALVREEISLEELQILESERHIRTLLVAPDSTDCGSAMMEIRAGTGGEEAAIFAGEMLRMYERYSLGRGWRFEIIGKSDENVTCEGSVREATANITGQGAFGRLKFESGVHRVQRVPKTDSQGRIHTSTVTVAILPEVKDVKIEINERDLRVDSYKSSGPGGQHVNKTNSAVRVVHLPTGIAVAVQAERCAQQNQNRAMEILRTKLYEMKCSEQASHRKSSRQAQIGHSDRSEKIRTYNFPQARVTDHRIGASVHNIDSFMAGKNLDIFIDQLVIQAEERRLSELDDKII